VSRTSNCHVKFMPCDALINCATTNKTCAMPCLQQRPPIDHAVRCHSLLIIDNASLQSHRFTQFHNTHRHLRRQQSCHESLSPLAVIGNDLQQPSPHADSRPPVIVATHTHTWETLPSGDKIETPRLQDIGYPGLGITLLDNELKFAQSC
jgi:hypothetical protein